MPRLRPSLLRSRLALPILLALTGCAAHGAATAEPDEADGLQDPWENTNRALYDFNDRVDDTAIKPVARAYRDYLPEGVRQGVHNVLQNASMPIKFTDDVLQGSPRRDGDSLMRFVINSTAGLGGVFDVATLWGYPAHDTDFGITLARWRFAEGPYLFIPFIGPSDARDGIGAAIDGALVPLNYAGQGAVPTALGIIFIGFGASDQRSRLLDDIEQVKKTALDPYATFRSLYRQHRLSQIRAAETDSRAAVPAVDRLI